MAKNLQSKLTPSDTVRIFDVNKGAMTKWASEAEAAGTKGAQVELADSAFDASKDSVCYYKLLFTILIQLHTSYVI
jgi:hypothetical protein